MADKYQRFYELAGRQYPEDELTYSSLSGLARKKWVQARIRELPAGNLLDCGCNTGRISAVWRKGEVFGTDIALGALQRGRVLFPQINFIQGDLRQSGFIRTGTIDNAVVIEVLEHLEDPRGFLDELYRSLKAGGRLLVTTPGYAKVRPRELSLGILKSYGIEEAPVGDRYHHTAYKPSELAALLSRAGFRVLEQGSFEHELRGWVKPLIVLSGLIDRISRRWFPRSRLNILIARGLRSFELDLFHMLDVFGFSRFLRRLFPEGRRTFVLARK
jgi:SAM-dependent methyltransferase